MAIMKLHCLTSEKKGTMVTLPHGLHLVIEMMIMNSCIAFHCLLSTLSLQWSEAIKTTLRSVTNKTSWSGSRKETNNNKNLYGGQPRLTLLWDLHGLLFLALVNSFLTSVFREDTEKIEGDRNYSSSARYFLQSYFLFIITMKYLFFQSVC